MGFLKCIAVLGALGLVGTASAQASLLIAQTAAVAVPGALPLEVLRLSTQSPTPALGTITLLAATLPDPADDHPSLAGRPSVPAQAAAANLSRTAYLPSQDVGEAALFSSALTPTFTPTFTPTLTPAPEAPATIGDALWRYLAALEPATWAQLAALSTAVLCITGLNLMKRRARAAKASVAKPTAAPRQRRVAYRL